MISSLHITGQQNGHNPNSSPKELSSAAATVGTIDVLFSRNNDYKTHDSTCSAPQYEMPSFPLDTGAKADYMSRQHAGEPIKYVHVYNSPVRKHQFMRKITEIPNYVDSLHVSFCESKRLCCVTVSWKMWTGLRQLLIY